MEQFAKAVEHYKPKAGQEDVPYVNGYLTLATAYVELGKNSKDPAASKAAYQSSVDECEKLLKLLDSKNPSHAQVRAAALYSRGVAERMLGEYVTAIRSFTQALELNPELGDAYFRRGICFHLLGEDRMAIADFEQAAHMSYDDPRFSLWAGFTYAKLGDYHKALRAYGDAIAASDRYTPAYYNRGLAYLVLGDYEKAIEDFNDAIRLDPTRRRILLQTRHGPRKARRLPEGVRVVRHRHRVRHQACRRLSPHVGCHEVPWPHRAIRRVQTQRPINCAAESLQTRP